MRQFTVFIVLALSGWLPASAQSVATASSVSAAAEVTNLEVMTVSGVMPGPGLWKVSKGGHVLWVLGTLSPLPQRMQWESQELDEVISQSQQVLRSPAIRPKVDVSFVGKLFLMPSAYGARKNESGKKLEQVLPEPMYARWLVLKERYIGKDRRIERWRPIFAAQELYRKAIRANDLSRSGGVQGSVDELAKKHGVPEVSTDYALVIDKPRAAIKAFKESGLDDVGCFGRTLDSIERDMPLITARANAWATGDLAALRKLPESDRFGACVDAITGAGFAHKLGFDDAPERLKAGWLAAARTALTNNAQTFAMLPMDQLLASDGYLSTLKAEGYEITAPDEDEVDPDQASGQ